MKTFPLLVLIVTLACHGCEDHQLDREAISVVMRSEYQARKNFEEFKKNPFDKKMMVHNAVDEFCAALKAIDTSKCPKEFKLAFFDYRKAIEGTKNKFGDAFLFVTPVKVLNRWDEEGRALQKAEQALERLCLKYDVGLDGVLKN